MKKWLLLISLYFYCFLLSGQTTGINNNWLLGYGSYWGHPWGHTLIDFSSGTPVYTYDSLEMDINRTSANISDTNGNLLFYTNGYYIADATGDTMQNGNNISPTGFYNLNPKGLTAPQACLILPKSNSNNLFYLFHNTFDNSPSYTRSLNFYCSIIDMNLNNGKGAVVSKNNALVQDIMIPGNITACKHANGRDWWVIVQKDNSNLFYKFLILPTTILGPYTQAIGTPRSTIGGMSVFSPDGTKYAIAHAEYLSTGRLDIFDFDRCNGFLSNSIHITLPQSTGLFGGTAFSSNSNFLYVSNINEVYQYDMSAPNIAASQLTVAVWDSFYSPSPPFATLFDGMQLAPDGKIYIQTGNGTLHLHVINYPDSLGAACDLVQHGIQIQKYYGNGIPNHPNYFLGCDTTLGCGCLTGIDDAIPIKITVSASPNPTYGQSTLQFPAQKTSGALTVYNLLGKIVFEDYIAPWSQFKKIDINTLPNGIYLCKLKWSSGEISVKVIKE